ncbi:MAG: hypothetical protein HYZ47_04180 [Simkania negevensis]|nr:hypothetical protein [Simkania negevensis]
MSGTVTLKDYIKQSSFKNYPQNALIALDNHSKEVTKIQNYIFVLFAISIIAATVSYRKGWKRSFFPLSITCATVLFTMTIALQLGLRNNNWWKEHVFSLLENRNVISPAILNCLNVLYKEHVTEEELRQAFFYKNLFSYITNDNFKQIGRLALFCAVSLQKQPNISPSLEQLNILYPFIQKGAPYGEFTPPASSQEFLRQLQEIESGTPTKS